MKSDAQLLENRNIYFIPKGEAFKIKEPVNLISICGNYDNHVEFKVKHNLLRVQFLNEYEGMPEVTRRHLISDETIDEIMVFFEECSKKQEDIVIHCGEGSIRSPALAMFLQYLSDYNDGPHYWVRSSYNGLSCNDSHFCRYTRNRCIQRHAVKITAGKAMISHEDLIKRIDAAGLAYSAVLSGIDDYLLPTGRAYLEEEAIATIERCSAAAAVLSNAAPRVEFRGVKDSSKE